MVRTACTLAEAHADGNSWMESEEECADSDTEFSPASRGFGRRGGSRGKMKSKPVIQQKGGWTDEEDGRLARLVEEHGERSWSMVASLLGGRIGKQCRERWHNHLQPGINRGEWTAEEETLLVEAHKSLGNKWAGIAAVLPGRTENSVKNHWNATLRRKDASPTAAATRPMVLRDYITSLGGPAAVGSAAARAGAAKRDRAQLQQSPGVSAGGEQPWVSAVAAAATSAGAGFAKHTRIFVRGAAAAAAAPAEAAERPLKRPSRLRRAPGALMPSASSSRLEDAAGDGDLTAALSCERLWATHSFPFFESGLASPLAPRAPRADGDDADALPEVDALLADGWNDDDIEAMLRSDLLCDPFDLIIPVAGVSGAAGAAPPPQVSALAAAAAQAPPALAAAAQAGEAAAAAPRSCAAEAWEDSAAAAAAPAAHAAPVAPAAAATAAAAAPGAVADGSVVSEGSRLSSPRAVAGAGGKGAAALAPAADASAVTPGAGAWSAAAAAGNGGASSPAVSSGATAGAGGSPAVTPCAAADVTYEQAPLMPLDSELTAQLEAAFGADADAAAAEAAAKVCGSEGDTAADAATGDVVVFGAEPLAPQALILAATEGLPGGGWETASYASVVAPGAACPAAAAAAVATPEGAAAARSALRRVCAEVRARWPAAQRVVLAQRACADALAPGEVAVVVAVTSHSWAASIAAVTFAVACLKAAADGPQPLLE